MEFRTDVTKAGATILSLYGPDASGGYAGVIEDSDVVYGITWKANGEVDEAFSRLNNEHGLISKSKEVENPSRVPKIV